MLNATFVRPDLTTFTRLDELGLEAVGQHVERERAVLACRVVEPDQWCRRCGCEGTPRDTVTRRLAHEPFGWRPTVLVVTLRRYRCGECGHVWRQDMSKAAEPRSKLSRRALRWALEGLVVAHLTVARIAEGLAVSWNTANDAVLAEGQRVLINDPTRFDGVSVVGVDEHVWRHTRKGDVACHEHGTGVAGFLPGSWDHLDCQSWDHPACRAGGSWVGSLDRRVVVAVMEVYGRGIQGGQCG